MGAVFRPKDLPAGWRKVARESIKDSSPDTKDSVIKIIDSWEGTNDAYMVRVMVFIVIMVLMYFRSGMDTRGR